MASKKDKAPLQSSKGKETNEPKVKKSAKTNPAAEKGDPLPDQPEEAKAAPKAATKKAAKADI